MQGGGAATGLDSVKVEIVVKGSRSTAHLGKLTGCLLLHHADKEPSRRSSTRVGIPSPG